MSLLLETLKSAENVRRAKRSNSGTGRAPASGGDSISQVERSPVVGEEPRKAVVSYSSEPMKRGRSSKSSRTPPCVSGLADLKTAINLEPGHKPPGGERNTFSEKSDLSPSVDWDFRSSWEDGFPDFAIFEEKLPEHHKASKGKPTDFDPVLLDDLARVGLSDKSSEGDHRVDFTPSMEVVLDEDVVIPTDKGDGNIALGKDQTELTVVDDPRLEGGNSEALLLFEEPPKKELIAFESLEEEPVAIVAVPDVVVESLEPAPVTAEPLSSLEDVALSTPVKPPQGLSLELEAPPFLDPVAAPSMELAPTVPLKPVVTSTLNKKTANVASDRGERHGWSERFFSKVIKNLDRGGVQKVENVSSEAVEVSNPLDLTSSRSSSSGSKGKGDAWSKASKLMASRRLYDESVRRRRWIYSVGAVVATVVVVVAGYFVNKALAPFDEEMLQAREEKTAQSADLKPLNEAKLVQNLNVGNAPSAPLRREQGVKTAGGPLGSEVKKNAGLPTELPNSEEGLVTHQENEPVKHELKQGEAVKSSSEAIASVAPQSVQENGSGIRQPNKVFPESQDRKTAPLDSSSEKLVENRRGKPHLNGVADSKGRSEDRPTKRENRDQRDEEIVQASEAFRKGNLNEAERLFLLVYKANNRDSRAMVGLASVASRRGNVREEEYYYRKILRLDPRNSMALAGLAGIQGYAKVEVEEGHLRQQLRETPEAAHLHFFQGNMLASQKRWSEAVVAFKSANRLEAGNPEILVNLAVALDHLHQTSAAVEYYQQALDAAQRFNKVNFNIDSVRHRMTVLVLQAGKS